MVIQHNIAAINSYRNLGTNQSGLNKNLEKLSSGYRINRAGDDAAGLAISESMRSQINGLNQATKNAQDAVGLIQTAEGALTEVHSMLQRLTTLASQSANGTYNSVARQNLQSEVDQLLKEIDRIANNTDFNGIKPLKQGNGIETMTFQIGPSAGEVIKVNTANMTASAIGVGAAGKNNSQLEQVGQGLGISASATYNPGAGATDRGAWVQALAGVAQNSTAPTVTQALAGATGVDNVIQKLQQATNLKGAFDFTNNIDVTTLSGGNNAIDRINVAINYVSSYRAQLGAAQNRLEHTINNLKVTSENITAAESRIRDTDMADEITSFTKNNILLQASQSMLAQSNSVPQSILSLLQ